MASAHSGEMLKQAEHIWKMLDELADTDPEAYKKFIQQNMKEGKTRIALPEPFMCIKTKILEDKSADTILYVNVCQWTRVPGPKTPTDAVPITAGPLEAKTLKSGQCKVTRVAINPDVLKECAAQISDMGLLIELIFAFLGNQHSIRISRKHSITDEKYIGDPVELKNFFNQKNKFEEQVTAAMDDMKTLSPETLLARMNEMSVDDDNKDNNGSMSGISLGSGSNKARSKDRVLIEEIGSTQNKLPEPRYELSVKERDNRKGRRVLLRVELPGVDTVTECDLQINKGVVTLHVEEKYHLEVTISEPFCEDAVSAKFIKKSSTLSVTLPIDGR